MDKQMFKQGFIELLESSVVNEQDVERFFSKDYVQYADGKKLDYEEFVQHMYTLKKALAKLEVNVRTIAKDGNVVFTNHLVSGRMKDGKAFSTEVIAEFRLRNDQVYYCNELTRLVGGAEEARDMGSRID